MLSIIFNCISKFNYIGYSVAISLLGGVYSKEVIYFYHHYVMIKISNLLKIYVDIQIILI